MLCALSRRDPFNSEVPVLVGVPTDVLVEAATRSGKVVRKEVLSKCTGRIEEERWHANMTVEFWWGKVVALLS